MNVAQSTPPGPQGLQSVHEPFPQPMVEGRLVRRYKRFLADVERVDEAGVVTETFTAHCANTGSMRGLVEPGNPTLLWDSKNPKRKLPWSWKAVRVGPQGAWVGIDTQLPNALVARGFEMNAVPGVTDISRVLREQKMGEKSRVDVVVEGDFGRLWVEVKNATLVVDGVARFPDAVTTRGRKHLQELQQRVAEGDQALMVFVVQRDDADAFEPADDIDPAYGAALREAVAAGVQVMVWGCTVAPAGVTWTRCLPWRDRMATPGTT